jgi:hypothetical protein
MRAIDLGDTLEHNDALPGALELLDGFHELRDDEGKPPVQALIFGLVRCGATVGTEESSAEIL